MTDVNTPSSDESSAKLSGRSDSSTCDKIDVTLDTRAELEHMARIINGLLNRVRRLQEAHPKSEN